MKLKQFRRHISVVVMGVLLAHALQVCLADTTRATATAQPSAARFERGLLWRVESADGTVNHLFGTIHIGDSRVTTLPKPVEEVFTNAKALTLEAALDAASMFTLAEKMMYRDNRTLPTTLGNKLYEETRVALKERGLPHNGIEKYKPWAVTLMLVAPKGTALDLVLQQNAMAAGKKVHGLETVSEQLDIFDQLSEQDQVTLLKETLRERDQYAARLEELTRAYIARDLSTLLKFADKYAVANPRLQRLLKERLLTMRNHRMVERMQPQLKEGQSFIAIGAAHLPGSDGVLQLLERKGYRLTPVY